jgi:hypothetical protein
MKAQPDDRRGVSNVLRLAVLGLACALAAISGIGGAQAPETGRLVEFEVTNEPSTITGFVVGYFVPGKSEPAFEFRVPRARAQLSRPGIMRFSLIQGALPAGSTFVVRIQTVMGAKSSEWSAPSEPFTVSEAEALASAKGIAHEPSRQPTRAATAARSAATQLDGDPALRGRLSKLFPDQDLAKAAVGFRTVRDLVAALHVASNLKIKFEEIKRLTADAGNRNLQKAIAQLRPDVDARAEARRAQRQSREVLTAPGRQQRK